MRLILIRHAKSAWDDPTLSDHDRPLNARGWRSARTIGAWLAGRGEAPDEVLCSTARRAVETWEGIAPALPQAPAPILLQRLYHAGPDTLLRQIRGAQGQVVALIAHNPGIGDLAAQLVAMPPEHPRFLDYPTGATLIVDFDGPPARVDLRAGQVVAFAVPRDLMA